MNSHQILVGTSGFSYRDWVGPFYPPGTSHRDFLRIYQQTFPLVEINATYYQLPSVETSTSLLEKVEGAFQFVFKTHGDLTHTVGPSWKESARRFLEGLQPIRDAGRLLGILIQLPYSFHYDVPNRRHLAALIKTLGHTQTDGPALYVEFRNQEWQKERVYAHLEDMGAALVQTDLPNLPGLPLPKDLVVSRRGYLRVHGRNAGMWWNGDNRSRYDYLYDGSELSQLAGRVAAMAERADELIVTFNNHANAQAAKNAYELLESLRGQGYEVPGGGHRSEPAPEEP